MRCTGGCRCVGGVAVWHVGTGGQVTVTETRSGVMTSTTETGDVTGTKDKDYNLIWFTEACLSNALRLETYIQDAERDGDSEVTDLFRKAQADSRKGAEQGKALLRSRLSG
jgi:hypothetical protein